MTRKKIYVTAEDIAKGQPAVEMLCPNALAIKRETNLTSVRVNKKSWSTRGFNRRLGVAAIRFLEDFDSHDTVQPFTFITEVPDAG